MIRRDPAEALALLPRAPLELVEDGGIEIDGRPHDA
jgi:hypothetical protein